MPVYCLTVVQLTSKQEAAAVTCDKSKNEDSKTSRNNDVQTKKARTIIDDSNDDLWDPIRLCPVAKIKRLIRFISTKRS